MTLEMYPTCYYDSVQLFLQTALERIFEKHFWEFSESSDSLSSDSSDSSDLLEFIELYFLDLSILSESSSS